LQQWAALVSAIVSRRFRKGGVNPPVRRGFSALVLPQVAHA